MMDKETAAVIEAWIKASKRAFVGSQTEYARGYRRALDEVAGVIKLAKAGNLESVRSQYEEPKQ